jgi:hypothetical protein
MFKGVGRKLENLRPFRTHFCQKILGINSYQYIFFNISSLCFNMAYMVFTSFNPRLLLTLSGFIKILNFI